MKLIKPQALKKGMCVGVCSPASFTPMPELILSKSKFEELGYNVYLHPQVQAQDGAIAGTVKERVDAIHDLFLDKNVDAIFFAAGGYGCIQLLNYLNYDLIKQNPKIIVGYSDVSLLLSAIHAKTGLVTFHGPSFVDLATKFWCEKTKMSMESVLSGEMPTYNLLGGDDENDMKVLQAGTAEGSLLGGNHVRMTHLVGTPFMPDMESCIFFAESNKPSYPDLDGNLHHLHLSGALKQSIASLMGYMEMVSLHDSKCHDKECNSSLESILLNHFPEIPIVMNFPFSHDLEHFLTFPLGCKYRLEAFENNNVILTQLEESVIK